MTALYVPGTSETDPSKVIMSVQNIAGITSTNTAAITALQTGTVKTIAGNSGDFTLNSTSGITNSTNDILLSQASSSQFGAVKVDNSTITATAGVIKTTNPLPAPITNSLGADVALNNTANYFAGPSVAQGVTGTWFASGKVTMVDTAGVAVFSVKLWDGTTVIDSTRVVSTGASNPMSASLSGYLATPAGNLTISVRDATSTSGKILFNDSGNSKDSTLTAYRIA